SLLRLIMGFTVTAMFFGAEYWLVGIAPDASRGRIVAIYSIILSGSYAIGPKMLGWVGLEGFMTYGLPASILVAAILPVWWGQASAPRGQAGEAASPARTMSFFRTDPLILWGVVLFGMIEFGAMGLLSVWGVRIGLAEGAALLLLSVLAIGSAFFQLPVGIAADRYDRRRLLALAGFCSVLAPLGMIAFSESYGALVVLSLAWGGMAVALYTIALTELGARYRGADLAAGNAAVVMAYGLGALLAPASFGAAMDVIPPDGVLWLASASALGYLVLALVRIARAGRNPLDMGGETRR
ncbi:MAG: MFS transporter, partial [Pseudomonadota bacterium]